MRNSVSFAAILLLLGGCVSSRYANTQNEAMMELKRQRDDLARTNSRLEGELRAATEQLGARTGEILQLTADVSGCRASLEGCKNSLSAVAPATDRMVDAVKAECRAKEGRAFADGQLRVLQSLEIIGQPSVETGWFFNDHYYTFQVRANGKAIVLSRIHTHESENGFARLLSSIPDLAVALGLRR